jgi:ribosomal protein S19
MARSVWKGPFVDGYLLKKADAARSSTRHEMIRIWSRRSTILPQFVGLTFGVYNGQKHIPVWLPRKWSATSSVSLHRRGRSTAIRRIARPSAQAARELRPHRLPLRRRQRRKAR